VHGPWETERVDPFYFEYRRTRGGRIPPDPLEWSVDGAIMREPRQVERLLEAGIPTVFITYLVGRVPGTTCVMSDDEAVARMAAEHFIHRGFESFVYVGHPGMYWSDRRGLAFRATVEEAGFTLEEYRRRVSNKPADWARDQESLAAWLLKRVKPLAVFVCNDDRAEQVAMACRSVGLKVPEEVAVLGVDNDEFVCELSNPPLSSVALAVESAGYMAAQTLDEMMRGKSREAKVITVPPTRIVERRSTDVLALRDAEVATALRYIYENARSPLQVEDVAREVGVSRRNLYDRFMKALGRSVHDEIARVRAEQIAGMLRHTRLTVPEIARLTGCPSASHLTRFFKRHKGTTPRAYRQERQRLGG